MKIVLDEKERTDAVARFLNKIIDLAEEESLTEMEIIWALEIFLFRFKQTISEGIKWKNDSD